MNLQQFAFNSQSVRVISINGDPWFVATDVLTAIKSTTKVNALKAVLSEDLGDEYVNNTPIPDSLGRLQETTIVHEAAVTFLVSRSRTATGKAFNRLLHAEILPTIRKTGKYEVVPSQPALPQNFAEALRLAADLEEQKQRLVEENQRLELQAAKDAPKIDDYNRLINTEGWMCVREIHKCLAIPDPKFTQKSLNAFLRDPQVKILSKDTNQPYANWVAKGLAKMQPDRTPSGFAYNIPVFSYKGCIKILEALKNHGRIPVDHQCEFDFGFKVERPSAQYAIAGTRN